jgi:hypothetical protein
MVYGLKISYEHFLLSFVKIFYFSVQIMSLTLSKPYKIIFNNDKMINFRAYGRKIPH